MTREEIINGLKFTIKMFLLNPITGETITEPINDMDKTTIDACRGAIELLEQEPSGDLISRADVRHLIAEVKRKSLYSISSKAFEKLYNGIDDLPLINPQPKTGHWKNNKCDVCGASRPPLFDNFCPNCGAKMKGET